MTTIARKSTLHDLLNPCQIKDTDRAQAFVESASGQYQGGSGEIRFSLPANDIMDLTESYVDCLVQLNTTDAAVSTEYTLDLTGAAVGSFLFTYDGSASAILAFNATSPQVAAALQAMTTIGGRGFVVTVTAAAQVYTISVAATNWGTFAKDNALQIVENVSLGLVAPLPSLVKSITGSAEYPRLEYLSPIINQLRIKVGSEQIINISDANILSNMITLFSPIPNRAAQFYLNSQQINGMYSADQFRIRLELNHIDFLSKIIPAKLMNQQINIYMKLESNDIALIQGPTGGGKYVIDSPRLHYHSLRLTDNEEAAILEKINGSGLVIPFQSWNTYTDNIASGAGLATIKFSPSVSNLLAVFFVMSPEVYAADATNHQKTSVFLRNRVGTYRLKLGNKYFPTDTVDSINPGHNDMVEPITELENAIDNISHIQDLGYDRQIYYNFNGGIDGNDPNDVVYDAALDELRRPTFVGGISVSDAPKSGSGYICRTDVRSGQNVEMLTNVSLEITGLNLTQSNTIRVFSLSQSFLIVSKNNIRWKA